MNFSVDIYYKPLFSCEFDSKIPCTVTVLDCRNKNDAIVQADTCFRQHFSKDFEIVSMNLTEVPAEFVKELEMKNQGFNDSNPTCYS